MSIHHMTIDGKQQYLILQLIDYYPDYLAYPVVDGENFSIKTLDSGVESLLNTVTKTVDDDVDYEKVKNESKNLLKQADNLLLQHHALSQQEAIQIMNESDKLRELLRQLQITKSKNKFEEIVGEIRKENKVIRELLGKFQVNY